MKPKSEALAYRIWAVCSKAEWDLSVSDVAEILGENVRSVSIVMLTKGWLQRLRASVNATKISAYGVDGRSRAPFTSDAALDGGGGYTHVFRDMRRLANSARAEE